MRKNIEKKSTHYIIIINHVANKLLARVHNLFNLYLVQLLKEYIIQIKKKI